MLSIRPRPYAVHPPCYLSHRFFWRPYLAALPTWRTCHHNRQRLCHLCPASRTTASSPWGAIDRRRVVAMVNIDRSAAAAAAVESRTLEVNCGSKQPSRCRNDNYAYVTYSWFVAVFLPLWFYKTECHWFIDMLMHSANILSLLSTLIAAFVLHFICDCTCSVWMAQNTY